MRIEGSYHFEAPPDVVWALLQDPFVLQQAIPGCECLAREEVGRYGLTVRIPNGPFYGRYQGTVSLVEKEPEHSYALALSARGEEHDFSGNGVVRLDDVERGTTLTYEGDVQVTGRVALQSPRLVRTTANYLTRIFFEGFDRQVRLISGTAKEEDVARIPEGRTPRSQTIGLEDFLAELRRDRWVAAVVLLSALLLLFSFLGVLFVLLLLSRWMWQRVTSSQIKAMDSGGRLPSR